ncbi:tail fiber protein [Chromobacterium violaceum]|uniref:tail fiber protein n=1 Tax=Chromobacterium violaceum TaxID=536 RepID=UPI00069F821C|nr:tail fiber protein [Chromobacterium violaceum]
MQDQLKPINSPDGQFHDGNPYSGELGTVVTSEWLNGMQSAVQSTQQEMLTLLKTSGQSPDPSRKDQLQQAVQNIAWGGNSKPTTLAGYGITDGVTQTQLKTAVPSGQISYFSMPSAPDGWLKANGAQVSQTTYNSLFSAIGHIYRPNKNGVVAMLRLDDKDQLQERLQGQSVQLFGGAALSADVAKFGFKCLKTTRDGGYATFNLPERLNSKQFTLEGWHMPMFNGGWPDSNVSYHGIVSMNNSNLMGEITLAIESSTGFPTVWLSDGTEKKLEDWICYRRVASAKRVFSPRTWYHIAFSYDGGTYRFFVDGKLIWSLASARQVGLPDNVLQFSVDGSGPYINGSSDGYYQDWKVSNICNYAAEFSPPSQPVEYLADVDPGKFYLPNLSGEFIRGFDDLNNADPGRQFGSWQKGTVTTADPNLESVTVSTLIHNNNFSPDMCRDMGMDSIDVKKYPVARAYASGTPEYIYDLDGRGWQGGNGSTRPRNVALLACVKY